MADSQDADERHARGPSRAGIVYGVSDVGQAAARLAALDLDQSVRGRLRIGDVFGADYGVEGDGGSEPFQRDVELITEPARENAQLMRFAQPLQETRLRKPAFARDQSVAVFAEED